MVVPYGLYYPFCSHTFMIISEVSFYSDLFKLGPKRMFGYKVF